ncbi:tRNA-dihydrouridine(20a/20b) synthase [NAD(P)+]-like isoform X2 [Uranotaenia lowii]|nr:tRNA-dihydrouridine(20a/20b) synthase [NAD(P)+]-like isoform X2 [Uranotaenia lowii]
MIMADSFCQSEKARQNEFTTNEHDTPVIAQFAAKNSVDLLSASEMVFPYVDGVDLNCGCPQRWAMADGYGSALLKNPELIADMLGTVRRNLPSTFSVSVKVRLLNKGSLAKTIDMCQKLQSCGITFITVHGRTPAEKTNVPVDKEALKQIKSSLQVPVVANGDVFHLRDADEMFRITKCDGVMAARGMLSNPALFAGYDQTPTECIQRWLDVTKQADTDITYQAMHHHLTFMAESILTRQQRIVFNNLTRDKLKVLDFLQDQFQLEAKACDHPKKINCIFDEELYRSRKGNAKTVCANDSYSSESTDGAFFKSKVDVLDEEVASDVDLTEFNLFENDEI